MSAADWLQSFEEYDTDNCIVCKAAMPPNPPYMGHIDPRTHRWVAHFSSIYPFCHALCMQEAMFLGFRPCIECNGKGIYYFSYRANDEYERESVECPCCPDSRGYFIYGEPIRTVDDVNEEWNERARDEMYGGAA